jgi:hypothetical protein
MNTKIKAGVAALLAAGSMAATAQPANAYGYWGGHGGYYGHGRGYGGGALLGAGIAGLAVGAAIASSHPAYGYAPRYYGPAYYGYGTCIAHRSVWDPYYGGYVVRRVPVPC